MKVIGQKRRTSRGTSLRMAIAVCGAIAAAGCGANSPGTKASHKVADALPGIIGPAKHYKVDVDGDPFALGRGRAKRIVIDGDDVQLTPSLVVNHLHIDARDLSINRETHKVEHAGSVDFVCAVGQLNLDKYLAQLKPGISGLSVKIRWADLEATVPVSAAGLNTTARIQGKLQPSRFGPDKLDFVPNGAQVGVVPVPKRIVELATERINPVMDLGGLKFPVRVESARAETGRLYVRGTTSLGGE